MLINYIMYIILVHFMMRKNEYVQNFKTFTILVFELLDLCLKFEIC